MSKTNSTYENDIKKKGYNTCMTRDVMEKHTVTKLMINKWKCVCCNIFYDNEYNMKCHIHRNCHLEKLETHMTIKNLEKALNKERNKRKQLEDKNAELQRQLFEYNGTTRVKSFLEECSPTDTVIIEEHEEKEMPDGRTITRIISYEAAHSSFDEIYDSFCKWSSNLYLIHDECKEEIKKYLIDYQSETYGINIGEYEWENKKNGTYDSPRFDFKFESLQK